MSLVDNPYFEVVRKHADSMLEFGRPLDNEHPCPLFAGTIDVGRKQITDSMMVPPPGIRMSDFNWCGNNLMHDLPFLETLLALSTLTGDSRYSQAVEDVIVFYGANCPDDTTGLFPWGEHLQWSHNDQMALPCMFGGGVKNFFVEQYMIHDHLGFAPQWFWETMWKYHPDAVVKFAHGLHQHIVDEETFRHSRHAPFNGRNWRSPEDNKKMGGDFARHSGHYIFDCLFAFKKSGDSSLVDWSRKKLEWHLMHRLPNGLVRNSLHQEPAEGQHDGLALSVADAADMLGRETPEGKEFGDYADELFEARANEASSRESLEFEGKADGSVWVSGYFRRPSHGFQLEQGNFDLQLHRRTGSQWFADAIVSRSTWEAVHRPAPPPGVPVLARSFSVPIDNALAAYELTGENAFLETADRFAGLAVEELFRNDFLMGASNMKIYRAKSSSEYHVDPWAEPSSPGFYFSVSRTPLLVRNLLRLALKMEGEEDILGVDLYSR